MKDNKTEIVTTSIDFKKFRRLPQKFFNQTGEYNDFDNHEQFYEDVRGFESLRIIFKINHTIMINNFKNEKVGRCSLEPLLFRVSMIMKIMTKICFLIVTYHGWLESISNPKVHLKVQFAQVNNSAISFKIKPNVMLTKASKFGAIVFL